MRVPRSLGTHDGSFHADEVTACALLILFDLVDENKIVRTRNADKLAQCEFVCDVGGSYSSVDKRFDHHQVSYSGLWSSAGMVLYYLKEQNLLDPEEYKFLNDSLIHGVDEQDNGRFFSQEGFCSFSDIIRLYNPLEEGNSTDKEFFAALHFTLDLLQRFRKKFQYDRMCRGIVLQAMEANDVCLYFDRPLPWQENFFFLGGEQHPASFVCFPSADHQWVLRGIPPTLERRMEVRVPFPKSWAGLLGKELAQVAGIPGAIFCHKGLFLSVWDSRESCQRALQMVLQ